MQSIQHMIRSRRTVRQYLNKPVDKEDISAIVTSAIYAPSGMNNQSWQFSVVTAPAHLNALSTTVRDYFRTVAVTEASPPSFAMFQGLAKSDEFSFFHQAPAVIITSNVTGYPNGIADNAAALQNMLLCATELGLGSCWVNTLHTICNEKPIRALLSRLGVPENHTVYGAAAVGYAAESPDAPPRKDNTIVWPKE